MSKTIISESFDKKEMVKNILQNNLHNLFWDYQIDEPSYLIDNLVLESQKIFTQPDFNFRKIKKPLEKILKKDFNKEILNNFFGKLGNEIETLKNYGEFVVKFAEQKDIAGKGLYEPTRTCFSFEGKGNVFNYNVYEQIMDNNRRYQILLIESIDGKKIGRCILFYHGKGKIDVMNIYLRTSLPYGINQKSFFSDIISKYYNRKIIDNSNIDSGHCFYQNLGNFTLYLETLGYNDFTSVPKILSNCCKKRIPYNRFQVVEDFEGKNHFICNERCCENDFYEEHGNSYVCENCGNRIDQDNIFSHDGENYCEDCFNELFFYCSNCDETYSNENGVWIDNIGSLCQECFDEKYFYCSACNEIEEIENGIETDNGSMICEDCYSNNYFTCSECDRIYTDNNLKEHDSEYYCKECFDKKFVECHDCSETFEIDETIEYNGDNFCKNCFAEIYTGLIQGFVKKFQTKVVVQKNLFVK